MDPGCQSIRPGFERSSTGLPVLLREEPPRVGERALASPASQPAMLADLLAAQNAEQRRRSVGAMLHSIGFDWLAYGCLASFGERVQPLSLCTVHADPQWARHYCTEAYYDVDPRLHDAVQTCLPCTWTLAELNDRAQGAPQRSPARRFVADLGDTGMRGGAFFVLPGTNDGERHFVSLLSRAAGQHFMDGALLAQVLTLGLCLHEYYTRYSGLPASPAPGPAVMLTPVQREILGHLGRGESDKRIAYHMHLSSHAVDYHMRQLRRRFAVRNRLQLMQASRSVP